LFTPKLYILVLHPEKNIRQSMMKTPGGGGGGTQKYTTHASVKAATSNGKAAVTATTLAAGAVAGPQTLTPQRASANGTKIT
jgi:hypothetical protein